MNTTITIIIISHLPILAAVTGYLRAYSKLGKTLRVFASFIFLSGFVQFISLFLFLRGINNMPLLHFYVAIGFPLLVLFYNAVLDTYINNKVMWGIIACFVPFTILNSLFLQDIHRFNSNALVLQSVIVIILSLFTYLFFLNDTIKETELPDKKSLSWINSGLFIYHLSCLLIFYFGDRILFRFSPDLSGLTWIFHSFFSVVMYTCFFIGLWKQSKTRH